jgi:hypothetical protein
MWVHDALSVQRPVEDALCSRVSCETLAHVQGYVMLVRQHAMPVSLDHLVFMQLNSMWRVQECRL